MMVKMHAVFGRKAFIVVLIFQLVSRASSMHTWIRGRENLQGLLETGIIGDEVLAITRDGDDEHNFAKRFLFINGINLHIHEHFETNEEKSVINNINEIYIEDLYLRMYASKWMSESFGNWAQSMYAPHQGRSVPLYEPRVEEIGGRVREEDGDGNETDDEEDDVALEIVEGITIALEEPFGIEDGVGVGRNVLTNKRGKVFRHQLREVTPPYAPKKIRAVLPDSLVSVFKKCSALYAKDLKWVEAQKLGPRDEVGYEKADWDDAILCIGAFNVWRHVFDILLAINDVVDEEEAREKPKPKLLLLEVHGTELMWGKMEKGHPISADVSFQVLESAIQSEKYFGDLNGKIFMSCSIPEVVRSFFVPSPITLAHDKWTSCFSDDGLTILNFTPWGFVAKTKRNTRNLNVCYTISGLLHADDWKSVAVPENFFLGNIAVDDIFVARLFGQQISPSMEPAALLGLHIHPSLGTPVIIEHGLETYARFRTEHKYSKHSDFRTFHEDAYIEASGMFKAIESYLAKFLKHHVIPRKLVNPSTFLSAFSFVASNRALIKTMHGAPDDRHGADDAMIHMLLSNEEQRKEEARIRILLGLLRGTCVEYGPNPKDASADWVFTSTPECVPGIAAKGKNIYMHFNLATEPFRALWRVQPNNLDNWLQSKLCVKAVQQYWGGITRERSDCASAINKFLGIPVNADGTMNIPGGPMVQPPLPIDDDAEDELPLPPLPVP